MTPFFSVVIPLYNKERFIEKTIQSALNQTIQDFEIIIVNDGSTDDSLKKVEALNDKRLSVFNIKNQGVSHARNYGISKAQGNYIAFLDADDLWSVNHLRDLYKLLHDFPNCGLYGTAYQKKINNYAIDSIYRNIPKQKKWSGIVEDYFNSSLSSSIAWTSAVMVPKNILESLGGFDENIKLGAGEDTDLWIRIALKYPVAFNNTVSATHVLHADNRISNSSTNLRKFINLDVYEGIAKKNESFKKYIDFNRFSIAIQYILTGNKEKALHYSKHIKKENLNTKQRFLLGCNKNVLKGLVILQKTLRKFRLNLSPFI